MDHYIFIPGSVCAADHEVRRAQESALAELEKEDFLRAWCSLVYLFPGLHPDRYFDSGSEWPAHLQSFTAEAWRRFTSGELSSNEFYCYQAATTRLSRECAALERAKPWLFYDSFST